MLNFMLRAGAFAAEAALCYGSGYGSTKMMRLLVTPAPQHWIFALIVALLTINIDGFLLI
jgi:hypothetical protein